MGIRVVIGMSLAAVLFFLGPVGKGVGGEAAKGRPLYERHCLLCHGPEGRGDGPIGMRIDPPAVNFHDSSSRNKSDRQLYEALTEGHRGSAMPAWKKELSEEELRDILSYIRKLSGGPGTGPGDCC